MGSRRDTRRPELCGVNDWTDGERAETLSVRDTDPLGQERLESSLVGDDLPVRQLSVTVIIGLTHQARREDQRDFGLCLPDDDLGDREVGPVR